MNRWVAGGSSESQAIAHRGSLPLLLFFLAIRSYIGSMNSVASTKDEIVERIRRAESQLRALGVRRLSLFGSFARKEADPQSDVDLLVEFEPGEKSFDNFIALSFLLEELLQRPVELVTREALSPFIGPHILVEAEDVLLAT